MTWFRPAPLALMAIVALTHPASAQEYLLPPPVPPSAACNSIVSQGSDRPETHAIDISGSTGAVEFQYDTYYQPDRMTVAIDGVRVFDSNCIGTGGRLDRRIPLPPGATKLQVVVEPNCRGGSGTSWSFKLVCP